MYSEKSYKNYIFWLQVKRLVIIILLSSMGAALGVLIGKILESTVQITSFHNIIIIVSTVFFFLLALLLTVGTGKQVQDGYWRIAVLRKLTVIQKNLEFNNQLLKETNRPNRNNNPREKVERNLTIQEEEITGDDEVNIAALYKFDETALVPQKKVSKMKKKKMAKTIRKPEEVNG